MMDHSLVTDQTKIEVHTCHPSFVDAHTAIARIPQPACHSWAQARTGFKAHLPQETSSLGSQHMKGSAAHRRVHPQQQSHEWQPQYHQ